MHHCNNIDYKARNFPRKNPKNSGKVDKVLKFRNFYIGCELQIAITVSNSVHFVEHTRGQWCAFIFSPEFSTYSPEDSCDLQQQQAK